jgi:iron complex outermembrane receptor protein
VYGNLATAFETPTTTELAARVEVLGGFNPTLAPQRIVSGELGARGRVGRLDYDLAVFHSRTRDAIVQFLETTGRAFFRNAGATRALGTELGLTWVASPWLTLQAAHTFADYRFADYRLQRGTAVDTLDGKRLAGVPAHFLRLGVRSRYGVGSLDADWTWSDRVWGDDLNTVPVEGWGAGRLDLRLAADGRRGGRRVAPFVAVNNALDQRYVGSITLNGAGGRVRESAPGRTYHAGLELGWSILE